MSRDLLFLLKHDFQDGPGAPYYCPECTQTNGVLAYYPQLRHALDVRYVDFRRPRVEFVALVGEVNQICPVLILADDSRAPVTGSRLGTSADAGSSRARRRLGIICRRLTAWGSAVR